MHRRVHLEYLRMTTHQLLKMVQESDAVVTHGISSDRSSLASTSKISEGRLDTTYDTGVRNDWPIGICISPDFKGRRRTREQNCRSLGGMAYFLCSLT